MKYSSQKNKYYPGWNPGFIVTKFEIPLDDIKYKNLKLVVPDECLDIINLNMISISYSLCEYSYRDEKNSDIVRNSDYDPSDTYCFTTYYENKYLCKKMGRTIKYKDGCIKIPLIKYYPLSSDNYGNLPYDCKFNRISIDFPTKIPLAKQKTHNFKNKHYFENNVYLQIQNNIEKNYMLTRYCTDDKYTGIETKCIFITYQTRSYYKYRDNKLDIWSYEDHFYDMASWYKNITFKIKEKNDSAMLIFESTDESFFDPLFSLGLQCFLKDLDPYNDHFSDMFYLLKSN